jgi:hypothetical protein
MLVERECVEKGRGQHVDELNRCINQELDEFTEDADLPPCKISLCAIQFYLAKSSKNMKTCRMENFEMCDLELRNRQEPRWSSDAQNESNMRNHRSNHFTWLRSLSTVAFVGSHIPNVD